MGEPKSCESSLSEARAASDRKTKRSATDFSLGKVLGEGSYSVVFLAREKATEKYYALKMMSKRHIIKEKKSHIVSREKHILTMLPEVFFVKLFFTFQDEESLYYGLSLAKGGELLHYINKLGRFSDDTTIFYASEIFYAVNQLHSLNIIHRDLKPENVLLDENLHIKVTDFGTSKILAKAEESANQDNTKDSFVGSAQYVSPEMLKQSSASKSSDIWAIGVMIYHMCTGTLPFDAANQYYIFQRITGMLYVVPNDVSSDLADIIKKILVQEPEKRLGCPEMGGMYGIMSHPLFKTVSWEKLINRPAPEEICKLYRETVEKQEPEEFSDEDFPINEEADDVLVQTTEETQPSSVKSHLSLTKKKKHAKKHKSMSHGDVSLEETVLNAAEYSEFAMGNEIIKIGFLHKKKGMSIKRRVFLLTEGPNMYYVDPVSRVLKGKIVWKESLHCIPKSFEQFQIQTDYRTYHLEDRCGRAQEWIDAIHEVHRRYFC